MSNPRIYDDFDFGSEDDDSFELPSDRWNGGSRHGHDWAPRKRRGPAWQDEDDEDFEFDFDDDSAVETPDEEVEESEPWEDFPEWED